jgi:putative acetyltransferase
MRPYGKSGARHRIPTSPAWPERSWASRILQEAAATGHQRLHVHASLTARPAFERFGFAVDAARLAEIRGQQLQNFNMSIGLKPDDNTGHAVN